MDSDVLIVRQPNDVRNEREYVASYILEERLQLKYEPVFEDRRDVRIELSSRAVHLPDVFFSAAATNWLDPKTLPVAPASRWTVPVALRDDAIPNELPIVFGDTSQNPSDFRRYPLDVFGTVFFFLSRYEEYVCSATDEHGRFPDDRAYSVRSGMERDPLVDYYIILLGVILKRYLGANVKHRLSRELRITHDIDRPFGAVGLPSAEVARKCVGDIWIRKNPWLALRRAFAWMLPSRVGLNLDPNNTFDYLMTVVECADEKSEFYFIVDKTSKYDPGYKIDDEFFVRLMREIDKRGHTIGLHPSYGSLDSESQIKSELARILEVMKRANIDARSIGGRHHYLRWSARYSWDHWADAGLAYDSSIGFSSRPGFRASTAHQYPAWSFRKRCKLPIVERPLVLMDQQLLSEKNLGLSLAQALDEAKQIMKQAWRVGGDMTLLWHNDALYCRARRRCFESVIKYWRSLGSP